MITFQYISTIGIPFIYKKILLLLCVTSNDYYDNITLYKNIKIYNATFYEFFLVIGSIIIIIVNRNQDILIRWNKRKFILMATNRTFTAFNCQLYNPLRQGQHFQETF